VGDGATDALDEVGSGKALFVRVCTGFGHAHLGMLVGGFATASVATVVFLSTASHKYDLVNYPHVSEGNGYAGVDATHKPIRDQIAS